MKTFKLSNMHESTSNIRKIAEKMVIMRESCKYTTTPDVKYSILSNALNSETLKLPTDEKYLLLPRKFRDIVDRADKFRYENLPSERTRDNLVGILFDAMLLASKYETKEAFAEASKNGLIKTNIDLSRQTKEDFLLSCAHADMYLKSDSYVPYGSNAMRAIVYKVFARHYIKTFC